MPGLYAGVIANHAAVAGFSAIPAGAFATIRATFNIYYGHTSHGSQLISGLGILENEQPETYARPAIYEDDWIDLGDEDWETVTRAHLSEQPVTNLVLWSWCGQLSWMETGDVNTYLTRMSQLEADYPHVTFVYMTGHLDGTGPSGTLYRNNTLIRAYCLANNKVLYDFADIESFDPNGVYYPWGSDACEWCSAWCASHPCPACGECAHTHCFNCTLKGKTFWWLLYRLTAPAPSPPATPAPPATTTPPKPRPVPSPVAGPSAEEDTNTFFEGR